MWDMKRFLVGTQDLFRRNILGNEFERGSQRSANYCLTNEPDSEVVQTCKFQIGKILPH